MFIDTYSTYRKEPILFFPREKGGINTARYIKFGDRIDYTLFDLKQYFENKPCKLLSSYMLPRTQSWLRSFNDFGDLVKYLRLDRVFTDENNNIFDLEKNDGGILYEYYPSYTKRWSETYYKNVKEKLKSIITT